MTLFRAQIARVAIALIACAPLAAQSQTSSGLPGPIFRMGTPPYTFAASCDLSAPLVFVNVVLRNPGSAPIVARTLGASDGSGVLAGEVSVPAMDAGAELDLTIPLLHVPGATGAIAGRHSIVIPFGTREPALITVTVPLALCGAPAPAGSNAKISERGNAGLYKAAMQTASPYDHEATSAKNPRLVTFKISSPENLKSAVAGADCAAHLGLAGALLCPDMIESGSLLLVWDWQATTGPDTIDGYRVYRTDDGAKQLVDTRPNGKEQTLSEVPRPNGGYTGHCYAVSAYVGTRESDLSAAFCAGGASVATTIRLAAVHTRTSSRTHRQNGGYALASSDTLVGFTYHSEKRLLGDVVANSIFRSAFAFDVSSLINRHLVAAKLHVTVVPKNGNADSCTTTVTGGANRWWENSDWIDEFGYDDAVAPTYVRPDLTADVTAIVRPWLAGRLDFGILLKNDDENLNAFTNASCLSAYSNPMLEVTYY